jgi:hypothetical protein
VKKIVTIVREKSILQKNSLVVLQHVQAVFFKYSALNMKEQYLPFHWLLNWLVLIYLQYSGS